MSFLKPSGKYIGIDLGTSSVLIVLQDKGIIKKESSIIAVEHDSGKILALGTEAKTMLGKTPEKIDSLMSMLEGGIANLKAMEMIISELIKDLQIHENIGMPKVLINIHIGMTEVEKMAIMRLLKHLGIKEIYFVEEVLASAIGAGINVDKYETSMILNMGAGTTEIGVVTGDKITACNFIKIAGDTFDKDIIECVKKKLYVIIGKNAAEQVKKEIATTFPKLGEKTSVTGRDLKTGFPKTIEIDSLLIYDAIRHSLEKVIDTIKETLDRTPPELLGEIKNNGLILTGGCSYIKGFDEYLSREIKINVRIADNPIECTALGLYRMLDNKENLKNLKITKRRV